MWSGNDSSGRSSCSVSGEGRRCMLSQVLFFKWFFFKCVKRKIIYTQKDKYECCMWETHTEQWKTPQSKFSLHALKIINLTPSSPCHQQSSQVWHAPFKGLFLFPRLLRHRNQIQQPSSSWYYCLSGCEWCFWLVSKLIKEFGRRSKSMVQELTWENLHKLHSANLRTKL